MTDQSNRQDLEDRVDQLESTISKMLPGRRDALKLGGAALVGGAAMSGSASAGTSQAGTIGTSGAPVDIESEDINNADTVTTQDLVVNGTATGPFGSDLQACRVFLNSDQSISSGTAKVQFDAEVYDSGNNFDTTNHEFTCPKAGLYLAQVKIRFEGGADAQRRRAIIGNASSDTPNDEGVHISRRMDNRRSLQAMTVNQYSSADKIAAYATNRDSNDTLLSGQANFATFMEVAFLGSL